MKPIGGLSDKDKEERKKNFGEAELYSARRMASRPGGFAMVTGGLGEFASFGEFQKVVIASAKVEEPANDTVRLTGPKGTFVEATQSAELPVVNRNGEVRDWTDQKNWKLYQTVEGELVSLGWKEGTLNLTAGGKFFTGTVTLQGWQKPDASPEDLEKATNLELEASFGNR